MNLVTVALYLLLQETNMTANQGKNESQNEVLIIQFSVSEENRYRLIMDKIPPTPAIITGFWGCFFFQVYLINRAPDSQTHLVPRG